MTKKEYTDELTSIIEDCLEKLAVLDKKCPGAKETSLTQALLSHMMAIMGNQKCQDWTGAALGMLMQKMFAEGYLTPQSDDMVKFLAF